MSLIERFVMLGFRRTWITLGETKTLLRRMREYMQCWYAGAQLPDLPKRMKKQLYPVVMWAAFMVSIKQPSMFVTGVLLVIPAGLITVYWLVVRMVALASRWIGA